MDVGDGKLDGFHGSEIPVIAASFLPEAKAIDSWPFSDGEPLQKRTADILQLFPDSARERGLQRLQEQLDPKVRNRRLNEDMDVFRHEDVGD